MRHALRLRRGRLFMERAGRVEPALFYCTPDPRPEQVARFAAAGIPGVSFAATADFHPYSLAAPAWLEDGTYDYAEFDARARAALRGNGDAWLLPRIHLCSPPWWDAAHEVELIVFDEQHRRRHFHHGFAKQTCASWSSRPWRDAAATNLRRLLEHAMASDFSSRIAGVLVCSGHTEEWFQLGALEGYLPDYSVPARDAFRRFMRSRAGADGDLTARWGFAASCDTAEVPPVALRRRHDESRFRDPRALACVIDFEDFLAEEAATFVGDLCGVVGDVSGGQWFAGAFFGYLIEMAFHGDVLLHGGHLGLKRVLADPRVHFLASPGSYARRSLRGGAAQSMLPVATLLAAGKAVFHENDVRTHVLFDDAGYGWTERPSETASAQRREAAVALSHGIGLWWFDMTGSFYEDPTTLDAIAGIARLARADRPERERAQVAFVVDEASFAVTDYWPGRYADVLPRQLLELARLGAAHDIRLVDELSGDHGYRFLIFPNLFRVERARLAAIRELIGGAGLSLFIGAVGMAPVLDGDPPGPAAVTGLPIDVRSGSTPVEIVLSDEVAGADGAPLAFGRGYWHPWRVTADAGRVRVLGRHAGSGEPAFFASRDDRGACVAYAADCVVPAAALRFLARSASVHLWLDSDDVVITDGSFLSVTAGAAGVKTIHTRAGEALAALDPDVGLAARRGVAQVYMSAGETRYFSISPVREDGDRDADAARPVAQPAAARPRDD